MGERNPTDQQQLRFIRAERKNAAPPPTLAITDIGAGPAVRLYLPLLDSHLSNFRSFSVRPSASIVDPAEVAHEGSASQGCLLILHSILLRQFAKTHCVLTIMNWRNWRHYRYRARSAVVE